MLYYVYFSNAGVPKTGLVFGVATSSLKWNSLNEAATPATVLVGPTITEVGGGWYKFEITYGVDPWATITTDLVGVIDGGDTLVAADRYKPVVVSLRGLALARIGHKGVQNKSTGDVTIYATDGVTAELKLDMVDSTTEIVRNIAKA